MMEWKLGVRYFELRLGEALFTVLVCSWFLFGSTPVSLAAGEANIKTIAVITGNEVMGKFSQPSGLFFDEVKKRLYIADSGNDRLVSFDSEFKYLAELSHEGFTLPTSIVRDKEGRFFVLDSVKSDIIFIDVEKKVVKSLELGGIPSGKERFVPGRMAIDQNNRLYIIDRLNKRILVVAETGAFIKQITVKDKDFFGFSDVKVSGGGEVYAIDTLGGGVYIFNENGDTIFRFGGRESKKGNFRFPKSLAVDKKGLIYVLDQHADRVFVFDKKGVFQHTISKPGVKEGELSAPSYIYMDEEERLYIIDGNRIQVFQEEKG